MKKLFAAAMIVIIPFVTSIETIHAADTYRADAPIFIYAPAINLFSPIQSVGTNEKGEMDVPAGNTNNVGWYAPGVKPGDAGTAVLDAHVFAAFRNLDKLPVGSDIYIYMLSGKVLRFVTTKAQVYALNTLSPTTLFAPTTSKQINLITCAGSFSLRNMTYDHRLIVSAQLV